MHRSLPPTGGETIARGVCLRLLGALQAGEFDACKTLPSENELAMRFGVSRSVVRDALSDLEREGFLQRMRGIGTVINHEILRLPARLDLKLEYNELIRSMGYVPSVDSVSLRVEPADEHIAAQLRLDDGEAVIVCEKRMLAGSRPVIYSIDRLPLSLFDGMHYAALNWSQPVFDLLETHLGLTVDTDIAQMTPTLGPPDIRAKLNLAPKDALLFIDEVGAYTLSCPIFQAYGYYTDFFSFHMLRKRF